MDAFHHRLARVGLEAIERYGFCLAGGYAVQAHGFLDRPSEDVDLFAPADAERDFPLAVTNIIAAYEGDGLESSVTVDRPTFARLVVTDPKTGDSSKVELGIDWRQHPPTRLAIGAVLHQDDAVANKVSALYSRGQARDYVDVHAVLASERYSQADLLRLAEDHDPGFDRRMFGQALMGVRRLPVEDLTAYRLDEGQAAVLVDRMTRWGAELAG